MNNELQTVFEPMAQALAHRLDPSAPASRHFQNMTQLELGRELLELNGRNTRGMNRMTLATEMLSFRSSSGSTDFPSLLANVANKRLRSAYEENPGTYAIWARRAPNAPDFKDISVVQLSAAPDLLQVPEAGEFHYGTMQDSGENYRVLTYGRIVSLTRQAIVNDDLRAFDRMVTAFGHAARRLENRLVYAQLTANANLADGVALFAAAHGNDGTAALDAAGLAAGRTAMLKQTGMQGEPLAIAPKHLIVPAALEQTAYQLTSADYVPATTSAINEFRTGGRAGLQPIVEPLLDGEGYATWYLAGDSATFDTVEYCYLDGAEGPVIEMQTNFDTDGVSYKCRLDFAAKAIDHRALYRSNGA